MLSKSAAAPSKPAFVSIVVLLTIACSLCRQELFNAINQTPTLFEVVTGKVKANASNKKARTDVRIPPFTCCLSCDSSKRLAADVGLLLQASQKKRGRPLRFEDINQNLKGRRAEVRDRGSFAFSLNHD